MKLLLIRHGEPNYELDCLTENGRIQAQKLAKRLEGEKIKAVYISPMGRAQETARAFLEGKNIPFKTLDWLHEFDVKISDPDLEEPVPVWDIYPKNWTKTDIYYDKYSFYKSPFAEGTELYPRYLAAKNGLDKMLADHGIIGHDGLYKKAGECNDTIAVFCHFGITCVMIACLLGVSPIVTLQGLSAEPTAIATLCTDDRFGEYVNFRLHGFGDISHLGEILDSGINYK